MELDRDKFRKWLASHPTKTIAGWCGSANRCPIALYLIKQTGRPCAVAWPSYRIDGKYFIQPKWVQIFVVAIDIRGPGSVTYASCLKILGQMK